MRRNSIIKYLCQQIDQERTLNQCSKKLMNSQLGKFSMVYFDQFFEAYKATNTLASEALAADITAIPTPSYASTYASGINDLGYLVGGVVAPHSNSCPWPEAAANSIGNWRSPRRFRYTRDPAVARTGRQTTLLDAETRGHR